MSGQGKQDSQVKGAQEDTLKPVTNRDKFGIWGKAKRFEKLRKLNRGIQKKIIEKMPSQRVSPHLVSISLPRWDQYSSLVTSNLSTCFSQCLWTFYIHTYCYIPYVWRTHGRRILANVDQKHKLKQCWILLMLSYLLYDCIFLPY